MWGYLPYFCEISIIMKHILSLFFIIAIALHAMSQTTQSGYVKTKGRLDSKGQLIPGARLSGTAIMLSGGHSTVSGADGAFTLMIPDKKFLLKDVQKRGYVLIDPEILLKNYTCSTNPLVITMETPEKQLEDQLKAERQLRRVLQQQLQQREQEIDSLRENKIITEEEHHKALQKLYAEQSRNEKLIADMAKRQAEIDYEQLDEFYRKVTFYIEKGDLLQADSLLRSRGDLTQQVEKYLQEGQSLEKQKNLLKKAELVHAVDKEELSQRCYSYYKKHFAQYMIDSAVYYLELRASLDTTVWNWQEKAGTFILKYQANYPLSLEYINKALRIAENQNDMLKIAKSNNYLGNILVRSGDIENGLLYVKKGLDIMHVLFDADNIEMVPFYNNLGAIYAYLDNYDMAKDYYLKEIAIYEKDTTLYDHWIVDCYNSLGSIYAEQGKDSIAIECYQKAISISNSVFGVNVDTKTRSYRDIGVTLYRKRNYENAIEYYKKALAIREKIYVEYHPLIAECYDDLGVCYADMKELDSAFKYCFKALELRKYVYGEEHVKVADSYDNIGTCYVDVMDYDKAIECCLKALNIRKLKLSKNHSKVGDSYANLAVIYCNKKDYVNALDCANKALAIYKAVYNEEHWKVNSIYKTIGGIYYAQNDFKMAVEYYQLLLNNVKKTSGEDDPFVLQLQKLIEVLKQKQ